MRYFYFLIAVLAFSAPLHSQSGYYMGYNNGFRFGCQCDDLPPKNVSTLSGTYDKGYADGKLDGSIYAQHKMNNTNQQNSGNRYNTNNLYVPDFDLIYSAMQYRQSAYSTNQQKIYGLLDIIHSTITQILANDGEELRKRSGRLRLIDVNFTRHVNEMNNSNLDFSSSYTFNQTYQFFYSYYSELEKLVSEIRAERNNTIRLCSELKLVYTTFQNYPKFIKDGWHRVFVINDRDVYASRKVLVKNNIIVDYLVEDCHSRVVEFSNPIVNGRTMISLKIPNRTYNNVVEIYFWDYLINPEPLYDFKPLRPGVVSFWTDGSYGDIEVIIDGVFFGQVTKYFSNAIPVCGQNGTLKLDYTPGTYSYEAYSSTKSWKGQFTVVSGQCTNVKLSK